MQRAKLLSAQSAARKKSTAQKRAGRKLACLNTGCGCNLGRFLPKTCDTSHQPVLILMIAHTVKWFHLDEFLDNNQIRHKSFYRNVKKNRHQRIPNDAEKNKTKPSGRPLTNQIHKEIRCHQQESPKHSK